MPNSFALTAVSGSAAWGVLPTAPSRSNPDWLSAPSFAATALLATEATGAAGRSTLGARLLWRLGARNLFFATATPYSSLDGKRHRSADLLPPVLDHVRDLLEREEGVHSTQTAALQPAERARVEGIFGEIAADMRVGALRVFAWLLSHAFRWLYGSQIYVNLEQLARLRELSGGGSTLVLLPTHKSHIDYLMLSYVTFAAGLPCPHIAAGANLSLPGGVGRLLRFCGAFFIRRTSGGAPDAALYKKTLFSYVRALLLEGHSLEFFIEGGRSRDGRVNQPKLGLLAQLVDVECEGRAQDIVLVPCALSYDSVLEEGALARQLAGEPKQKESLQGLAATLWGVLCNAVSSCWRDSRTGAAHGGYAGRASVRFGEPIQLDAFLRAQAALRLGAVKEEEGCSEAAPIAELLPEGSNARRLAIQALGSRVVADLRTLNVLPSSVLLAGALHRQQAVTGSRFSSLGDVEHSMEWIASEVNLRGGEVVRHGSSRAQLLHLVNLLPEWAAAVVASRSEAEHGAVRVLPGWEAALCFHWRLNQLLPWFAGEGLLACAALAVVRLGPTADAALLVPHPSLGSDRDSLASGDAGDAADQGPEASSHEAVLKSAAWLRELLAGEIDTAVGRDELRGWPAFEPTLEGMLERGQLSSSLKDSGALRLAAAGGDGPSTALFAAHLLMPLLATYRSVAQHVHQELSSCPTGIEIAALCDSAQAALMHAGPEGLHPAAQLGVVPSTALVQGAVASLQRMGYLVTLKALPPSPPRAQSEAPAGAASEASPARSSRRGGLDRSESEQGSFADSSDERSAGAAPLDSSRAGMPDAVASSVAAGLCRMAGPSVAVFKRQALGLAADFRSEEALQALLARTAAYLP